ncbi:i-spanin [Caulobacter phage Sansa]|uniref:I-spanin n=1 Tax=Caulobacter phage Sansa TaxID=1675600 RepID=A0A0K1LMV6_9CAUD|nr:i-spanin [Caulobacter phage Sansa]AKU43455.1 i-spanin [Caulobacter phage Sansa]
MFGIKTIATGLAVGALLGGGGTLALGGGALAIWNKTPFSATQKLKSTREDLVKVKADLEIALQVAEDRRIAIEARDKQALEVAKADAGDASTTAAAWGAQCSAAFNAGVSAGRRICNASSPNSGSGQPAAGGVLPSFRSEFEAERYTPAASRVPGAGQR